MVLFGISKKEHETMVREAVEFEVARVSASYEEAVAKRNKRIEDLKDQNMEFYNKRREAMDERVSVIKKSLDNVEVDKAVINELKEEKKQALLELAGQNRIIEEQTKTIKDKDSEIFELERKIKIKDRIIESQKSIKNHQRTRIIQAEEKISEMERKIKTQAKAIKMLQDTNSIIRDMITKAEMCIDEAGIGRQHGNL